MRIWAMQRFGLLAVALLAGCPSDVANQASYRCQVHADCRPGWHCAEETCTPGPAPPDMRVTDQGIDLAMLDAAVDAQLDQLTPDAAPIADAMPVLDARPIPDAMPMPDARPIPDAMPMPDARPIPDAAPLDTDGDGTPDSEDNCRQDPNPDQADLDGDGIGDLCDSDRDGDMVDNDVPDNCPEHVNPEQTDTNRDGIGDACEILCENDSDCELIELGHCLGACGGVAVNFVLSGACHNGFCGDFDYDAAIILDDECVAGACRQIDNRAACTPGPADCEDQDGDGIVEPGDNCPAVPNPDQIDVNGNGIGDACEDLDSDGVQGFEDNCPTVPNPRQNDHDNDGDGDACDDTDGDGIVDAQDNCLTIVNDGQSDRNDNGIGDLCEIECGAPDGCLLPVVTCTAGCGGAYETRYIRGVCNDGRFCEGFEGEPNPAVGSVPTPCAPNARCVVDNNIAQCNADLEFCEDPFGCEPAVEGAPCFINNEQHPLARCVDGVCRAWNCTDQLCNEFGPRRFALQPPVLDGQGDGFVEFPVDRTWITPPAEPVRRPRTVQEAHTVCEDFALADGQPWRLPTLFELTALAARDLNRQAELAIEGIVNGFYVSRTGDGERFMGVSLITGESRLQPPEPPDGHLVLCVLENNPMGQDIWDLSARRLEFTEPIYPGTYLDPLTGQVWVVPDANPLENPQGAQETCEYLGGELPSVQAITSLLTFNSGRAAPGFWLAFNGAQFRETNYAIWADDLAPVGRVWGVDLRTGAARLDLDQGQRKFVCVLPELEPEPDVMPEPDAIPEPDVPPDADAGVDIGLE